MSINKRPSNDDDNYTSEFVRWQRNQYSPGQYLGGDLPPHLRFPTRGAGYLLIGTGLFSVVAYVWSVYQSSLAMNDLPGFVFVVLVSILQLAAGIKLLKKSKNQGTL